ncbi:MAG: SIMPL domain-containing protein [Psychrobium sp.]
MSQQSNSQQSNNSHWIIGALLVATGIASSGYFISQTLYKSEVALNTAVVKGLAERRVESDKAYWTIEYSVTGNNKGDIPELYSASEQDQATIIELLKSSGFSDEEIKPGVLDYRKREYRDENQKLVEEKHFLIGKIDVETHQVHLVAKVRAKLNKLIAQGLDLTNNAPSYHFTKLNDIKPAMLKEATTNARLAANEFAQNAGVTVGGIRSARQGGFIIRDVGSNYGDDKKIAKDVRVVTNVTFFLTD